MAIFLALLGKLRGKLSAVVFSHNKGGDYVRAGGAPTNPNTSRQQTCRTILGNLAQFWTNTLTVDQRAQWNTYAENHPIENALGQEIRITGLAWMARVNARLQDAADTLMLVPPSAPAPGGLESLTVAFTSGTAVSVTYTDALAADERMQLWVSLPVSLGSSPNFRQCRLVGYSAAEAATPIAFTLPHAFQDGTNGVFFAAILNAEGLIGPYETDDAIYTAP